MARSVDIPLPSAPRRSGRALNASQLSPTHRPALDRFEIPENIAVARPLVFATRVGMVRDRRLEIGNFKSTP